MNPKIIEDFYIKQKEKMLTQLDKTLYLSKDLLLKKIDEVKIESVFNKVREEYVQLIPKIPYIGGNKNSFTSMLIDCVNMLAIFRILEKEGFTYNEIGEYSYQFFEKVNIRKKEKAENAGKKPSDRIFQNDYIEYLKIIAKQSQKRIYPGDWVMEFVEGDEKIFDYGLNFTECGIEKLFKWLGSEKFVPFICLSDFIDAQINLFGFHRTQTIGNKSKMCDHRFIKNGTTLKPWPPNSLKEWKMDNHGNFT